MTLKDKQSATSSTQGVAGMGRRTSKTCRESDRAGEGRVADRERRTIYIGIEDWRGVCRIVGPAMALRKLPRLQL